MRWDRLTIGIGLSYALLAWSLGYGAVLPELRDELHMSASLAAIHGSLFGVGLILIASLGSRLLAAVSNRTTLAAAVAAMAAGGVLFGVGRTSAVTLAGAALAGTGAALFVIVVPGVVYAHQPATATHAMSTLNAFPMASATLLPMAVSAAAAAEVSWRAAYLAPLLFIALGIAAASRRSAVPGVATAERAGLRQLFVIPRFARRWLLLVCGVLVELGTGIWAASIMREQGGASKSVAALLTAGFFVGMATGRILLSHLLHRMSMGAVLRAAFVGCLLTLVPFLLGPGLGVRVVGLTLFGLMLSPVYPVSITRLFELHVDTAALGRAAALASGFGVTFGPLLLGAVSDVVGLGWATLVLPAFLLVGLLMAASTPLRRPRPA